MYQEVFVVMSTKSRSDYFAYKKIYNATLYITKIFFIKKKATTNKQKKKAHLTHL